MHLPDEGIRRDDTIAVLGQGGFRRTFRGKAVIRCRIQAQQGLEC